MGTGFSIWGDVFLHSHKELSKRDPNNMRVPTICGPQTHIYFYPLGVIQNYTVYIGSLWRTIMNISGQGPQRVGSRGHQQLFFFFFLFFCVPFFFFFDASDSVKTKLCWGKMIVLGKAKQLCVIERWSGNSESQVWIHLWNLQNRKVSFKIYLL